MGFPRQEYSSGLSWSCLLILQVQAAVPVSRTGVWNLEKEQWGSEEESEKVGLKLNIQKMKIMASGPITSWKIDGETMETVQDFLLGFKSLQMVTAAMKLKDACSLEEKL